MPILVNDEEQEGNEQRRKRMNQREYQRNHSFVPVRKAYEQRTMRKSYVLRIQVSTKQESICSKI